MNIVYANEPFPEQVTSSIFLMGPTPRSADVVSWRKEAVELLIEAGYTGTVFIPEPANGQFWPDYHDQIEWENTGLNCADIILCWLPRDLDTMPAFTTNTEFGEWFKSGKLVFGAPLDAPKTRYQIRKSTDEHVPIFTSLWKTIKGVVKILGDGAFRQGGECQVPIQIWQTESFQNWYRAQLKAGNRLDGAKVEWTFRVGPEKEIIFFWALHVSVYIASEDRLKTDIVIARPDISTVVMYYPAEEVMQTEVVLIREFRSSVSNDAGFVYEVPGGSSFKSVENVLQLAADEVMEETGLTVDLSRIQFHGVRQVVATMSAHKAHVFALELNLDQLNWLKEQKCIAWGVEEDSERTYVEVHTLQEIKDQNLVDWSMLGMILSVIN